MSAADGLVLEGVRKGFDTGGGRVEVLDGVDLRLAAGEAVAITGPSGSGKSTLLHLIGALDAPDAGRVALDGIDPYALPDAELARFRNRQVGFVFQDHHLLPQYSILENALLPAQAFGAATGEDVARARSLLERVGLSHRLDHRPGQISGGERQRAAVARALVREPRLLLCDEPTGSLDRANADGVAELLFELHRAEGNILIVVTHSGELAGRFARRAELDGGRLAA